MTELRDTYGRVHDYLRISLTERCNLRCFYCMPEEGVPLQAKESYMQTAEVLELARLAVDLGVRKIRLTGGEPLLRKDFPEILSGLAALDVDLGLTTNAILLDRHLDQIRSLKVGLNISLDSLDPIKNAQIVKRDFFDRIWTNLQEAVRAGLKPKVNVVLIKGVNDDEIVPFVELGRDQELEVRFIEFMPFGGNSWDSSHCVPDREILQRLEAHYGTLESLDHALHYTARDYRIPGFKGKFGLISTITEPFCHACNRLRLTADGKLKNCLFALEEVDVLQALRRREEIAPLFREAVARKHWSRGGMDFSDPADQARSATNRSMVRIGG